jgi:uncharacterized lipoprotein YbaY/heat shock protein HslJ/uncharacterized lipoprotein NlpE involved in copper resistance
MTISKIVPATILLGFLADPILPRGLEAQSAVTGTATYRERMALPPSAVLEVVVADVSRADAPAEPIGSTRIENPGTPPFAFSVPYDPMRIIDSHTYAVRARIVVGDLLLFTTDQAYWVISRGRPTTADLLLQRVSAPGPSPPPAQGIAGLPATFAGDLPCADCPGIRYHLNLWPDRVFFLRLTYRERATSDDIGSWTVSSDGRVLVLKGGREAPEQYLMQGANTLRKLDMEGREIQSGLNYDLTRTASLEPFEPRLSMRGMYRYMADAGRFRECSTYREMPVAQEGDNAALESAYSMTRGQPNEELMVSLEGRIAERPRIEGGGIEQVLVPEKFLKIWPGETCGQRFATAELVNTYWKLTRVGDEAVVVRENQREAHLILRLDEQRVGGSTGCNQITGTYRLDGASLLFGPMASTRMACEAAISATETRFLQALMAARRWSVRGEHLELYDEAGRLLARFESRYMK